MLGDSVVYKSPSFYVALIIIWYISWSFDCYLKSPYPDVTPRTFYWTILMSNTNTK